MRKKLMMIIALAALAAAHPAYAQERDNADPRPMKFVMGVINGFDGAHVLLNEQTRVRTGVDTEYFGPSGFPASGSGVMRGRWIYLEGYRNSDGTIDADKIYMLPGYVGKKDKWKYPFINIP